MKIYTIISGVNGVGKSSFSGVLKAERSDLGHVIDTDKIAAKNKIKALDAGKIAIGRINDYISKDISFSQETTLSGQRIIRTVKAVKEKGYFIRLFYIGLNSCEESVKRIKNRVEKGGHDIKVEDVTRRYNSRFDSLLQILPFCNEVFFYDNENGFTEVGGYKNGELICKGDFKPEWLHELQLTLQKENFL